MADQDKENRRTRRAQRREQAQENGAEPRSSAGDQDGEPSEEAQPAGKSAPTREDFRAREPNRDRNRRTRERAADERRDRRRAPGARPPTEDVGAGLDATEMVDDVLARTTHSISQWIRGNSLLVQTGLVAAFLGVVGFSVWGFYSRGKTERQSDGLFAAVETRQALVGEPPEILNGEGRSLDPRPSFATDQERLSKSEEAFRAAAGDSPATALLAKLGLAGVLFDQGKFDEAKTLYEQVKSSPLAAKTQLFKGRSIEGLGLCAEAKGDLEQALKSYSELESLNEPEFPKLGLYHRARLAHQKGDDKQAKDLLGKLKEKSGPAEPDNQRPSFFSVAVAELEQIVDPASASAHAGLGGEALDPKLRQQNMKRLMEQLLQSQPPSSPPPAGSEEPAPTPAPPAAPAPSSAP